MTVTDARYQIRPARPGDAGAVAELAAGLADSFACSRAQFDLSYRALLAAGDACLLLAPGGEEAAGYLLGFQHLTFYANGPAGWVEEVFVRPQDRGHGTGRALMSAFEQWAADQGCVLVALATRRGRPSTARWATSSPPFTTASCYMTKPENSPVPGRRTRLGSSFRVHGRLIALACKLSACGR